MSDGTPPKLIGGLGVSGGELNQRALPGASPHGTGWTKFIDRTFRTNRTKSTKNRGTTRMTSNRDDQKPRSVFEMTGKSTIMHDVVREEQKHELD
jgi:hypothetical protein